MTRSGKSVDESACVLHCTRCEKATLSTTLGSYSFQPDDFDPVCYTLVKCNECEDPALLVRSIERIVDSQAEWGKPVRIWPTAGRNLSHAIPRPLRKEAEEARECFEIAAYTATVVMVRRTLEGVCNEHGIGNRNLGTALKEMHDQGNLDDRLLEWSQELRVLGNQGAHYTGRPVSRVDASDALDLLEAMLDYIYVLAKKFAEFQSRRSKLASTTSVR